MAISILTGTILLAIALIIRRSITFYYNIKVCQKSGIPFVCVPFYPHSIPAQVLAPLWRPTLSLLPCRFRGSWYIFMNPSIFWDELYAPFRVMGIDTIILCSPSELLMHTCSAEIISQVSDRRTDFPKPVKLYSVIDIYGKSAISAEGDVWRRHRKVITRPFNENNNRLVWLESLRQAQSILLRLFRENETHAVVNDIDEITSRIALAIISKAGFGVSMDEFEDLSNNHGDKGSGSRLWAQGKTNGHSMPFADAIFSVATDIFWLFAFPRSLLKWFPHSSARRASQAYLEWGQYMREMIFSKRHHLKSEEEVKLTGSDLLTNLVQSARAIPEAEGADTATQNPSSGLSDEEIMGNAFLLIMAGYETTASNLQTAILLLAMHVDVQRKLQADIDRIFEKRLPAEWSYDADFTPALSAMPGAVLSETLRCMPPVIAIPKWTPSATTILINGKEALIPKSTTIAFNVVAAHRNPNQWPHGKPKNPDRLEHPVSNSTDDLGEFRPERWLSPMGNQQTNTRHATGAVAGLYRPRRGAYLPFSEGSRACLGRRFSQVEIVAILCVIFQNSSVELEVLESDERIATMDETRRHQAWDRARDLAQFKFRNKMRNLVTNRMSGTSIAVRFVKRGEERFKGEVTNRLS